ncbi:MAG: EAL domain-containing protein [Oscillospiraceae bacterium]|nr:EAL domain-containing protein [Oscillospiraceae bacterium]
MGNNNNIIKQIRRTVLIVEDEWINTEILSEILSDSYEILTAENGVEALRVIRESITPISLVLLDINMPVMGGFEFLSIIKADEAYKRLPIIVLTSEKAHELRALELGASDFITKPYDMPEVIQARVRRSIELSEDRMIIQAAERDELTDTYTPHIFVEYAAKIDRYHPDDATDLVVVNIDKFHLFNELYGYDAGAYAMRSFAEILKDVVRKNSGIVGRLQTDYFVLYLNRIENYGSLMQEIGGKLNRSYGISNLRFHLGVYRTENKQEDFEKRLDRAKQACDAVNASNKEHFLIYDDEAQRNTLFRERLVQDVRRAIEERQFEVYYQPKVNVRGDQYILSSVEALARWNHPELGFISPGVFIPLFEEDGVIRLVDRYIWREAARQIRSWKEKYGVSIPVSVNISRIDMFDKNLVSTIRQIVDEEGISVDDMYLEITESAYNNEVEQAIATIEAFKREGFTIEIDDFGSGYSSLNTIAVMPLDVLKLDMKFVREMFKNDKTLKIIGIVADIAKNLKVHLVAEGVETEEQLSALKHMGFHIIQGYYFSKPVPARELEKYVETNHLIQTGVTLPC